MEKYSSTLTSKGQTTIPVQVRTHLNLNTGDEIEFELIDDDHSGKGAIVRHVGLFWSLRKKFKEVLMRAKKYSSIGERNNISIRGLADILEDNKSEWHSYREQFDNYLNGLDFQTLKIIQNIVYLGRDEDYNKDNSPADIYRKYSAYSDENGWNTQEIEVNQILGKGPSLYGYLLNGFKILKIDV